MSTTSLYTVNGQKTTKKLNLSDDIFSVSRESSHLILKEAYLSYLAGLRANPAITKTRGLVSGGGRKPWPQKGRGKARFGSSRNPIWKGGGVAFGPTGQENHSRKINIQTKRLALKLALSQSLSEKRIRFVEDLSFKNPSVKNCLELLENLKLEGSILLVVNQVTDNLILSCRNVNHLKLITAKHINTFNVLNSDYIIMESSSLKTLASFLASNQEKDNE
jgi:large subunit ribosomal protein L4